MNTEEKKPKKIRRGRGEGSVWQLKDGTRCGQLPMGGSRRHRKRRTFHARTKQELLDKLASGRTKQIEGLLPDPSSLTIEQYLDHWTKTLRGAGTIAGSTADGY